VRHGQSEGNIKHIVGGDYDLTDVGKKQAADAAARLSHVPFAHIYSTGLKRTWTTGEIIRSGRPIPHSIHKDLRERGYGIHEDTDGIAYTARYGNANKIADSLPEPERRRYKTYPSYESDLELMERYLSALKQIASGHPGEHIGIASHGSAMRVLLICLNHIPRSKLDYGAVENAAHIIIESDGRELAIKDAVGITVRT